MMFMMSAMAFGAPGSTNLKSNYIWVIALLCHPIYIFVILWIFDAEYFGISGSTLTMIGIIVIGFALWVFGYIPGLINLLRGIKNSGYSVVGEKVYAEGKLIKDADSATFKVFDGHWILIEHYAADKNRFYYWGKVIEGVNTNDLRPVTLAHDLYWLNKTQVVWNQKVLAGANPNNFGDFGEIPGWTYSINDGEYIVFNNDQPITNIDRESFKAFNPYIAKDKNQIFYKTTPILNFADAATFEIVTEYCHGFTHSYDFGIDKNNVYYISQNKAFAIDNIDSTSFAIIDHGYCKDKNNVYYLSNNESLVKIEDADTESFSKINNNLFKDNKNVYYLSNCKSIVKVEDADAESFVEINNVYFKDKNNVYYLANWESIRKVKDADVESFESSPMCTEIIADGQDKNNYFHNGKISKPKEPRY